MSLFGPSYGFVYDRMHARSHDEARREHLGEQLYAKLDAATDVTAVAFRCHTEPIDWEPYLPKLDHKPWPAGALLMYAVAFPGTEDFWFVVWGFTPRARDGEISWTGLAYPSYLPERDITAIKKTAEALGIATQNVEPMESFRKRLYSLAYKRRLPVVGFDLARTLSLLAIDHEAAPHGGWDLFMWAQPDKRKKRITKNPRRKLRNGEVENPNRPRIRIQEIGSVPRIRFADRWRPDDRDRIREGEVEVDPHWQWDGRFVDLKAPDYGLTGEVPKTFEDACGAFAVTVPHVQPGSDIRSAMNYALRRLDAEAALYAAILVEHEARGVPVHLHRVFSPATYAGAMLRMAGVHPALYKWPTFPRSILGAWMGAMHGGESLVGLLAPEDVPLPVTLVDFTGGHTAAAAWIGAWPFLIARTIRVRSIDPEGTERFLERCAERMNRWLDHPTDRPPLGRKDVERLAWTLVEVVPRRSTLPHLRRNKDGTAWRQQVGPLTYDRAVPYTLLDVFRAVLEDGRIPEVVGGHRLVPVGMEEGLEPMLRPDGTAVATAEDLPLATSVFRLRIENDPNLSPSAKRRLVAWAKFVPNAIVSGLPLQVNRKELGGTHAKLRVVEPSGSEWIRPVDVIEEPGPWYFPPVGVAVFAAQRMLSYLARELVRRRHGTVPFQAVDSFAVISTPTGGLLPCEGGPIRSGPSDGATAEGYHALSFAEVDEIRETLEVFSPYPDDLKPQAHRWVDLPPSPPHPVFPPLRHRRRAVPITVRLPRLAKLERENFREGPAWRHQAYLLPVGPLRSYAYTVQRAGMSMRVGPPPEVIDDPSIVGVESLKASEQSLGQLLPPPGEGDDWIERAAERVLRARLRVSVERSSGEPAMALVSASSPSQPRSGGHPWKPYTRLVVLRPHPTFGPRRADGSVAIPAAIWDATFDRMRWDEASWFDFVTGEPLATPHVGHRSVGSQHQVLTYEWIIRRHFTKRPERVIGPNGDRVGSETLGMLRPTPTTISKTRSIGREMNALDRTGVVVGPTYSDYTTEVELHRLIHQAAQLLGATAVARVTGFAVGTVRKFIETGRTRQARWARYEAGCVELAARQLLRRGFTLPLSDDAVLRVFIREGWRCQRCGDRLTGKQRKWCSRCGGASGKQRGKRSAL